MAMALQKLFPEAQTTIGPWIERGFYYDFDLPTPLTPADLKAVKKEMVKIIKADLPFICEEVSLRRRRRRTLAASCVRHCAEGDGACRQPWHLHRSSLDSMARSV
jgi:threonyl-tRNA synthetase